MFPDKEPILTYSYPLRSRYSETDKMGYVYYSRYLEYFEVARTEFIREAGFPYREMEDLGVMLPVVHANLTYRKPIYYDTMMDVRVLMYELPSVRLKTFYKVFTDGDKPNIMGSVELCFVSVKTRRPVQAPDRFIQGIKEYVERQS